MLFRVSHHISYHITLHCIQTTVITIMTKTVRRSAYLVCFVLAGFHSISLSFWCVFRTCLWSLTFNLYTKSGRLFNLLSSVKAQKETCHLPSISVALILSDHRSHDIELLIHRTFSLQGDSPKCKSLTCGIDHTLWPFTSMFMVCIHCYRGTIAHSHPNTSKQHAYPQNNIKSVNEIQSLSI